MKVAVTGTRGFPGVQGGVESHCEQLYVHLARQGCDITVFTRRPYINPELKKYKGISLVPVDCPRSKFLEAFVHTFKSVLLARKLQPDILHIHAIGPSLFSPLARLFGIRVVVTNHGPDYNRKKWPLPAKLFLRLCEWLGMMFANEIIAIAGNIAEDISRRFRRNAAVIPNGVQIPIIEGTEESLKKYGLQKRRYVLSVGRFVPEKGFDCLMDAFNSGKFRDWKLVIVGGPDHEDNYSRDLRLKADSNRNIVLTGFLKGQFLHEIYSHAGIFVLPSYHEGLPIVLLEAMSYGLSCIVSDIPANRNIKLDQDRYFRPGDIKALAAKIEEFICKPWEEKDREKQISLIREQYNWEDIACKTFDLYKSIL